MHYAWLEALDLYFLYDYTPYKIYTKKNTGLNNIKVYH
jgi:hypothetical protein